LSYRKTKYNNKKVTIDGITFDSIKESNRFCELKLLERAGEIKDLKMQVPFELVPALCEPDTIGKRGGIKKGKTIEQAVYYYADFMYYDDKKEKWIVEDVKSEATKTDVYIIKRKLFKQIYTDYLFLEVE